MGPAFEEVYKEDKYEEECWGKKREVDEEDGEPGDGEEDAAADDHGDEHVTHWKPYQGEGEGKRMRA